MRLIYYCIIFLFFSSITFALSKDEDSFIEIDGKKNSYISFFTKNNDSDAIWYKANQLFNDKKFKKAASKFKMLYENWPNHENAVNAVNKHADCLLARSKWKESFDVYQYCLDNYGNRINNYGTILENQYIAAMGLMKQKRMSLVFGGYTSPEFAIPLFKQIVDNGPQWYKAPEALYMIGKCNQDIEKYEDAISAYTELSYRFPKHELNEKSFLNRIQCLSYLQKKFPVSSEIQERILTATTIYLSSFPASEMRNDIIILRNELYEEQAKKLFDQGDFYERVPKNSQAAIYVYQSMIKKFPNSQLIDEANNRIKKLQIRKGLN